MLYNVEEKKERAQLIFSRESRKSSSAVDATDGDYNNDNDDNAKVALIEPSYSLTVAVCANLV